jgi:hypothetical protein
VADDVANWELRAIKHLIERNHADTREDILDLKTQQAQFMAQINSQLDRYLPREVHQVKEDAQDQRIKALEDERADTRRASRTASLSAVVAIVAAIATVVLDKIQG